MPFGFLRVLTGKWALNSHFSEYQFSSRLFMCACICVLIKRNTDHRCPQCVRFTDGFSFTWCWCCWSNSGWPQQRGEQQTRCAHVKSEFIWVVRMQKPAGWPFNKNQTTHTQNGLLGHSNRKMRRRTAATQCDQHPSKNKYNNNSRTKI